MRPGWFLLLVLSASLAAAPAPLPLAVPADVYRDYECWLGKRTLANITDYHGPCLRRDVVDVALFQQALIAAGYAHDPQWEIINSYQRTLLELSRGKLPAAATSLWLKDIEATPGLAASDAVLPVGSNLVTNLAAGVSSVRYLPFVAGSAIGYNMLWTHICASLAPLMFGAAVDHLGGFAQAWWLTATCTGVGVLMLWILLRHRR